MISRAGSADFVIRRSQNLPTFPAVGFQEFLRSALAFRNGIRALGRLAAIPSYRWAHPIGSKDRQLGVTPNRGQRIDSFGGIGLLRYTVRFLFRWCENIEH